MPQAYQVGRKFKLYYDTSGVGGSSWTEIGDVEVVEESDEKNTSVIKNRNSRFEKGLAGQANLAGSFRATFNKGATWLEDMQAARDDDSIVGLAIMDGDITTAGNSGWQLDALITSCPRTQDIDDASTVNVGYMPHALSDNEPEFVEISA